MNHFKDNLPISPDDPPFLRNSHPYLVVMLFLAPLSKFCLMRMRLESGHKLLNVSLRRNKHSNKSPLLFLCPLKRRD